MDPNSIPVHDDTTTVGLIAALWAVAKVGGRLYEFVMKKMGKSHSKTVVELSPEASRAIEAILRRSDAIHDIVSEKDRDGGYLVHSPKRQIEETNDDVKELLVLVRSRN